MVSQNLLRDHSYDLTHQPSGCTFTPALTSSSLLVLYAGCENFEGIKLVGAKDFGYELKKTFISSKHSQDTAFVNI